MSDFNKACVMAVSLLCETFPGKDNTANETKVQTYMIGLKGLTAEQVEYATERALQECRYMPVPSELRALSGELSAEQKAIHAWNLVQKAIIDLGPYKDIDFVVDPTINAAIRSMGGWPQFIDLFTSSEAEKWVRKEFIDIYTKLKYSKVNGEVTHALPSLSTGRIEIINGERVQLPPPVMQIGSDGVVPMLPDRRTVKSDKPLLELKNPNAEVTT